MISAASLQPIYSSIITHRSRLFFLCGSTTISLLALVGTQKSHDIRLDLLDQVLTGHLLGLRQTHDGQTSRRDISKTPLFAVDLVLTLAARNDERHGVGRVRRVRRARVWVDHLLSVTVVGRDSEDVAGFLAGVVDGLDGLVGGGDGLDGGVKVTGVTDL